MSYVVIFDGKACDHHLSVTTKMCDQQTERCTQMKQMSDKVIPIGKSAKRR